VRAAGGARSLHACNAVFCNAPPAAVTLVAMTGVPVPLDVHALLNEQDFVRRLARSLVFDQDQVDDVVQGAWLAAMRQPPRQKAALPGWFGSVLRNLAQRSRRDAARRRAREAAAARPEALPSAVDVLAREQLRRAVVDAVLALPEPYRGTVLARFFDELEPVEIARRRGVPAASVRSQLKRGLDLLRARFDAEHGGRQAWCLSLLPLATPARAGGLSIAGALLMTKVLFGAGALALTVLAALWWSTRDAAPVAVAAGSGAGSAAADTAAVAPAAPTAERRELATPAAQGAPRAAADADAGGLRGRVVTGDGVPAADVLVRVLGIDELALFADADANGGLALAGGEARTAADGTFTIRGLPPRAHFAVNADADGDNRTLVFTDVSPLPGDVADLGDIALVGKGSIAGRAVDDSGQPVAGATVLALDLPSLALGFLPVDRFEPGNGGMLALPVPDAGEPPAEFAQRLRHYLATGLFERADLDREPGLGTFVVDAMPWLARIWRELPIARATTAADGSFALRAVLPGANLLIARAPGRGSGVQPRVLVRAAARAEVGDVVLPPGEELRGKVRDAGGRAVAGAEVRVATFGALGFRGLALGEAPVRTDADGAFGCAGLPRGRAFVAVRTGADAPWETFGPFATDDEPELTLSPRAPLRLQLAAPGGVAVASAFVELFAGPPLHELRRAGVQQRLRAATLPVDKDGVLAVGELPHGCWSLRVAAAGCAPVEVTAFVPQDGPLRVDVAPVRRIAVRACDEGGAPVAGARVYLQRDDPGCANVLPTGYGMAHWSPVPEPIGVTDHDGRIDVADAPRGPCHVAVRHPRFVVAVGEVGADASGCAVTLSAGGAIRGRLFDHGAPADPRRWRVVARTQVWFADEQWSQPSARLQPDGTFALTALARGTYVLCAQPLAPMVLSTKGVVDALIAAADGGYSLGDAGTREIKVEPGATVRCDFDVDPNAVLPGAAAAQLSGRVLENGQPRAGLVLRRELAAETGRFADLLVVGADGTIRDAALPAGRQHLRLMDGQATVVWEADLDLAAGERRVLDLAWSTGGIAGTATFASGMSPEGHVVTATGARAGGVLRRCANVDAAGRFAFAALPEGEWELTASGPDGDSKPVRATIAAGAAAAPIALLMQEALVLAGHVELGDRAQHALVVLRANDSFQMGLVDPARSLRFHFRVDKREYAISLMIGSTEVATEPARVDMRNGSQRDLVLRPAAGK
jgi:RNA polymerase sigma factor (sigma-70 family)